MAQFSFKRHHDANILNDKHVVCTVKCWRHGCNHVVFNVKLGHAALILNRLLRLCLCLCLCSEFAKSLLTRTIWNLFTWIGSKNFNCINKWHAHLLVKNIWQQTSCVYRLHIIIKSLQSHWWRKTTTTWIFSLVTTAIFYLLSFISSGNADQIDTFHALL